MAFEFKKLADVEALTEVPENATMLVEVDGAIKRVPSHGPVGMLVTVMANEDDSFTPNKTFQEVMDTITSGGVVQFAMVPYQWPNILEYLVLTGVQLGDYIYTGTLNGDTNFQWNSEGEFRIDGGDV